MQQPNYQPNYQDPMGMGGGANQPMLPMYDHSEASVNNIVGQIDPQAIIDNLDHALKGEQYNKEEGRWFGSGTPLVNDDCRNTLINYLTPVLTNVATMGHIDEKRLSFFMEGIIAAIKRMFVSNLEKFGFVPPGEKFEEGDYYNVGTPDSSRMTLVSDMIYRTCFLVMSRSVKGVESYRIFKSLSMQDNMGYGGMGGGGMGDMQKSGWLNKLFGRGKF